MRALRILLGWPPYAPANDCIAFSSGRSMDLEQGLEIGRIAHSIGKDVIHSSWANPIAREPAGFTIAYRMIDNVDIVQRVVPFAIDDTSRLILVSTTSDEHFAIDSRGSLARASDRPKRMGKGRALAMKRLKALAATLDERLLDDNRQVPIGAPVKRTPTAGTVVRFG